ELVEARFGGGVYLGELHGASDTDDVASIVARQFGLDSLDAMPLRSSGNAALVVLDNCESALAQAAGVAGRLIGENTELVVLATSRAPLNVPGERVVSLEPLTVPEDDLAPAMVGEAAAARLFLERAEAAGATWPLTDENLLAVGALVRQLDGLPLAIELAAARSRVLAPPNLVEMLDHQLDLLAGPAGGPPTASTAFGARSGPATTRWPRRPSGSSGRCRSCRPRSISRSPTRSQARRRWRSTRWTDCPR
ncbi:MAG: hypothetical protein AAF480_17005, partial [Actinomycetota bacterium]